MLLWRNDLTEPFRNMAAEEFLLMKAEQPCVMLWRNAPAVIIGKNQDARAEVDFSFAERHGIKIVRRLTGGGAVFHDTGNINYTFVVPDGNELDFSVFTKPVIDALAELGVRITTSGRNDLVTVPDAKKCSGTARYIYNRKTSDGNIRKILLHHGTLLFSADLASLSGVLTPDRAKLASKGIQSVKSRVVNLKELLPPAYNGMTAEDFKHYLEDYFIRNGAIPHEFTPEDRMTIERLAAENTKPTHGYSGDSETENKRKAGVLTSEPSRFPCKRPKIELRKLFFLEIFSEMLIFPNWKDSSRTFLLTRKSLRTYWVRSTYPVI